MKSCLLYTSEKNKNKAIAEFPTSEGRADYAMFIGLKLIGIIEAKKYGKTAAGDLAQAKEYSKETPESQEYDVYKRQVCGCLASRVSSNSDKYKCSWCKRTYTLRSVK